VHHTLRITLSLLSIAALVPPFAAASEPCSAPSQECAVVGKFELSASFGIGQRSNPVAGKSDLPLVVIPRISYYGKRFFLENLELGYTLHEGESSTFSLIAAPGYDRAFFRRSDLQNIFIPAGSSFTQFNQPVVSVPVDAVDREFPVSPRHTTYLAGPEWTFGYGVLSGQLNALREVTGEHDGYEVRGALGVPLIKSKHSLTASTGFTWKSRETVRYYYGVDTLYEPGSAFNPFIKLQYALPLTDRWMVNAFAHYERLASSIADSPVVAEDHVTTAFAGVVFRIR
jgi:MipA family protein